MNIQVENRPVVVGAERKLGFGAGPGVVVMRLELEDKIVTLDAGPAEMRDIACDLIVLAKQAVLIGVQSAAAKASGAPKVT